MFEKSVKNCSCLSKYECENNIVSGPSVLHWAQPRSGGSELPDNAPGCGAGVCSFPSSRWSLCKPRPHFRLSSVKHFESFHLGNKPLTKAFLVTCLFLNKTETSRSLSLFICKIRGRMKMMIMLHGCCGIKWKKEGFSLSRKACGNPDGWASHQTVGFYRAVSRGPRSPQVFLL